MHHAIERIELALKQNIGQTLTPELVMGLIFAIRQAPLMLPVSPPETVGNGYTAAVAKLEDCFQGQLAELHKAHWRETEKHRHHQEFKPDYDRAIEIERLGGLRLYLLMHGAEVVGNFMVYINKSTHTQRLTASEDTLFLSAAHRKGLLAKRFVEYAHRDLKQAGIAEIHVSVKLVNKAGDFVERILGYEPVAKMYIKKLLD
jgi:hypothetical protein